MLEQADSVFLFYAVSICSLFIIIPSKMSSSSRNPAEEETSSNSTKEQEDVNKNARIACLCL